MHCPFHSVDQREVVKQKILWKHRGGLTILTPKPINFCSWLQQQLALDWLSFNVELESVLRRISVAAIFRKRPLAKELAWGTTTKTVIIRHEAK